MLTGEKTKNAAAIVTSSAVQLCFSGAAPLFFTRMAEQPSGIWRLIDVFCDMGSSLRHPDHALTFVFKNHASRLYLFVKIRHLFSLFLYKLFRES
jgi:hypothetical protein